MNRSYINTAVLRLLVAPLALCAMLLLTPVAQASTPPPAWWMTALSAPTHFAPGSFSTYEIVATNTAAGTTGGPITLTDTLPAGFTPYEAELVNVETRESPCEVMGQTVTCTYTEPVKSGELLRLYINGEVEATSGVLRDEAAVSGGGAAPATVTTETPISSTAASFGFLPGANGLGVSAIQADGAPATQAGSHPYALNVNAELPSAQEGSLVNAEDHLRDFHVALPPGVVANPNATPVRCTEAQLESDLESGGGCPAASQIGIIYLTLVVGRRPSTLANALYNMAPPAGKPAEFGFDVNELGIYVHAIGGLETGSYQLAATSNDILAKLTIVGVRATLWGNPSDPSHDDQRGSCASEVKSGCPQSVPTTTTPFLTMPTSCSGSLVATASTDSWEHPGEFVTESTPLAGLDGNPIELEGCSELDFTPSIVVRPDTSVADSPSGLEVDLKVPQTEGLNTLATANLKDAVVKLPAGVSVSPSAANGLQACSPAQIALDSGTPPGCPDGSKLGSVEVVSPLLPSVLKGGIYLAQQGNLPGKGENPFGSLLAIYLTAEAEGAVVKLAGKVEADPVTGQLTTTFDDNPQLPFSDFKLRFDGGPRGTLATPEACGSYTTQSSLSPWSGTPAVSLSEAFSISSGCVNGFAPSFVAGVQNAQAGAHSPFTLSFSRSDTDQPFSGLSVTLPPGLLAKLAGVSLCTDPQLAAAAGKTGTAEQAEPSCPAASQVGSVQAGAGPGQDPFFAGGKAYLTGPYKGAPYGLAEVVPVVAGPFDLGTVVVRQKLQIDEHDAHVTAVSDPLPTIIQGIPLRLRRVDVDLDRSQFVVNPTSCAPMAIAGTLTSTGGASANVSSPFQVGGCGSLFFAPQFSVSTEHDDELKDHGAALKVHLAFPNAGAGEASARSVTVALPKALPARLSTLQKACTEAQFAQNPAGCPEASFVGQAVVHTPILSNPLVGPAIFVSHGGEAFPDLDLVLQGEGITIVLTGQTKIKNGVTMSKFATIPDAPVSDFQLTLPEGPHSALAAVGDLCQQQLVMPTAFVAQNGATFNQETQMEVQGCPNNLSVLSKKLHGRTLTMRVAVPTAGRLSAGGKGLVKSVASSSGRGTVAIKLHARRGGRFATRVTLVFSPKTGAGLSRSSGRLTKTVKAKA